MPGCKLPPDYKLSCKRKTILPGFPRGPEKQTKALLKQYELSKERPGFIDFHEYE